MIVLFRIHVTFEKQIFLENSERGSNSLESVVESMLGRAKYSAMFGAFLQETDILVGFAEVSVKRDTGGSPWGLIESLSVDAPHRRRGLGRLLIEGKNWMLVSMKRIHYCFL